MLVHTAARSCRSRATARRATDVQGKFGGIKRTKSTVLGRVHSAARVLLGELWWLLVVASGPAGAWVGAKQVGSRCSPLHTGARVNRRVVKNTQRNSRRCLRQRIAAVRQVRGRASEDYREVVMVREGTVRVNRYSPDDKRLGHHTGWLTFVLHYSTSVYTRASNTGAASKKSRSSRPTLCQHLTDTLPDVHAATRVCSCVCLYGIPEQ